MMSKTRRVDIVYCPVGGLLSIQHNGSPLESEYHSFMQKELNAHVQSGRAF